MTALIVLGLLSCAEPIRLYEGEKRDSDDVARIRSGPKALIVSVDDIPVGEEYYGKTDWRKAISSPGRWIELLPGDHRVTVDYAGFYRHYNPAYAYILMTGKPVLQGLRGERKQSDAAISPYTTSDGESSELIRMVSNFPETLSVELDAGHRYEVRVELRHDPLRPDQKPRLPELIAPADRRVIIVEEAATEFDASFQITPKDYFVPIYGIPRADQLVISDFPWRSYLVDLDEPADTAEKSVLARAVETGDPDFVELILATEETDIINAANYWGMTALHEAVLQGQNKIVTLLIGRGAKVDQANNMGATPLFYAAGDGHVGIVRQLLAAGASVKARQKNKWTPLHYASLGGHDEVIRILITAGADIEARTDVGLTPLSVAANEGWEEIVRLLLAHGARVQVQDNDGWTALHYSALCGDVEITRILLDSGAFVDSRSRTACTPLHVAAMQGNVAIGQILLDHGAEVNSSLKNGWTPLDLALERNNLAFAAMLMDHHGVRGHTARVKKDTL